MFRGVSNREKGLIIIPISVYTYIINYVYIYTQCGSYKRWYEKTPNGTYYIDRAYVCHINIETRQHKSINHGAVANPKQKSISTPKCS